MKTYIYCLNILYNFVNIYKFVSNSSVYVLIILVREFAGAKIAVLKLYQLLTSLSETKSYVTPIIDVRHSFVKASILLQ